jgi:hypothetical protein
MKPRKIDWIQWLVAAALLGVLFTGCSGSGSSGNGSGGSVGTTTGSTLSGSIGDSGPTGGSGGSVADTSYQINSDEKTITASDGSWEIKVTEDKEENSTTITKTYPTALTSLSTGAAYTVVEDSVTDYPQRLERVLAVSESSVNDLEAALMRSVLTETDGVFYVTLRFEYDMNASLQMVSVFDLTAEDETPVCSYTVTDDA